MDSNGIFGGTFSTLEKVLDLRSVKHNLIVSNIANVDTPNYKAFDLIVEEELGKALKAKSNTNITRTQPGHLPFRGSRTGNVRAKIVAEPQLSLRADGNSVDIDNMMAKLAENNLMYNALAQIIAKKFNGLKYVIQEGRR
jgi:flagellar basal-body rod protein FlgB